MRVSPGGRIAARGPSWDGQRLREPQTSAEMLLPSIHPLLWLLLLLPGELLHTPRGWRGAAGRGDLGGPASRGGSKGKRAEAGRCGSCHWEAQPLSSGVAGVRLLGKWGFVRFTGFVWQCWNKKLCFLVNERSISAEGCNAEAFVVSGFCQIRVKVERLNVQDIIFLRNTFYLHFFLSLI